MKSVRLTADGERRLRDAAARAGLSQSEFIRRAIERACDDVLAGTALDRRLRAWLADLPGGFESDDAAHSEDLFAQAIEDDHLRAHNLSGGLGPSRRRTA